MKKKIKNLIIQLLENMHEYRKFIVTLSCLVVFITTYVLILPAFTLEKDEAAEQGGIDIPVAAEEQTDTQLTADADVAADEEKEKEKEEPVSSNTDETKASAEVKTEEKAEAKDEKKSETSAKDEKEKAAVQEAENPLIYESKDFSVAVTDKNKELTGTTRVEVEEISADNSEQAKQYGDLYSDALKAVREADGQFKVADFEFAKFYDITQKKGLRDIKLKRFVKADKWCAKILK